MSRPIYPTFGQQSLDICGAHVRLTGIINMTARPKLINITPERLSELAKFHVQCANHCRKYAKTHPEYRTQCEEDAEDNLVISLALRDYAKKIKRNTQN